MRNKLLSTTSSLATTFIGVDAPLPSIDLDKILTIVADSYDYTALVDDEKQFNNSNLAEPVETFAQLLRKHDRHLARVLAIFCAAQSNINYLMAGASNLEGVHSPTGMLRRAPNR